MIVQTASATGIFKTQPRELAHEAFKAALERYPDNAESALIFFAYAVGLGVKEPTVEDIKWAQEAIDRRDRETFEGAAHR